MTTLNDADEWRSAVIYCIAAGVIASCCLTPLLIYVVHEIYAHKINKNGICIKALITDKYIKTEKRKSQTKTKHFFSLKYAVKFEDKYYLCQQTTSVPASKYTQYDKNGTINIYVRPSNRSHVELPKNNSITPAVLILLLFPTGIASLCIYWGYTSNGYYGLIVSIVYTTFLAFIWITYLVLKEGSFEESIISTDEYNSFIRDINENALGLMPNEQKSIERTSLLEVTGANTSDLPQSYIKVQITENNNDNVV